MTKKIISTKKTSFVRAGGRNIRFSVYSIIVDKNKVGFGKGKSKDMSDAIDKSFKKAGNELFNYYLVNNTIPYKISTKVCKTILHLKPTCLNVGLIAGGCVRLILRVLGIKNIISKIQGSRNKFNSIKAFIIAFKKLCYDKN